MTKRVPKKPLAEHSSTPDAPQKWKKRNAKARSYYQLHQDLDRIVAAWIVDTKGLPSQHSIMELIEWSFGRTMGNLSRSVPKPAPAAQEASTASQDGGQ